MSDHETDWIIPSLLRHTGLHVVTGDGADAVAAALFCKGHAMGASVMLAEPRWTGLLHDLEWDPQCALRTEHCLIVPTHPLWRPPTVEGRLANADVALQVRDGLILTLRGGMANARPVEVASLVPVKTSSDQVLVKTNSAPPAKRDSATVARRFRAFSGYPSTHGQRPFGWQRRGWRKRFYAWLDQMRHESWEREARQAEVVTKVTSARP